MLFNLWNTENYTTHFLSKFSNPSYGVCLVRLHKTQLLKKEIFAEAFKNKVMLRVSNFNEAFIQLSLQIKNFDFSLLSSL